jgi:D-serine deaminase-like pyridoxal phosphate-dependent protein
MMFAMMHRRGFLGAGLAAGVGWSASKAEYRLSEIESRLAKRKFDGITKADLGTPALILDRDLFEQNLRTLSAHSSKTGLKVRPHVKVHKCVEVTQRQIELGAIGATTATVAESEYMVAHGVKGVFWTRQPAGRNNIARATALAKRDNTFMAVVDDPLTASLLEEAAAAAKTTMNVAVDVYAGLTRHGIEGGEPALALAKQVDSAKHLKLAGLMGYSGMASHTKGWENRRKQSLKDLTPLLETTALCRKAGVPVEIVSGGSTGTYNIDAYVEGMTELQAGSYVFMDTGYRKIGAKDGGEVYGDFAPALTVLTTVMSRRHKNQATIDAGNKAMLRPTDEVKGRPTMRIENQGAEYGIVRWTDGPELKLGDQIELYPTNLDMSVNAYDRIYVARGDAIVDMWQIMGRTGPPQR